MGAISEAVDAGDLDRLTRLVDGLCEAREWEDVVRLRDRCRQALEDRGLQLWPAAEYAEYRLALDAPGSFAGPVVTDAAGRFALGPLWEVAASTHTWDELADHIPAGPARSLAAHERVLRGEDLSGDDSIDAMALELPLVLGAWEAYPVATYRSSKAEFPSPPHDLGGPIELPGAGPEADGRFEAEALESIAIPWQEQSNGRVAVAATEGSAESAVAALGHGEAVVRELELGEAAAHLCWVGSSGGAYGRRRGSPMGRFGLWWLVAALADLEWPPDPGEIGDAGAGMRWLLWEPTGETHGWSGSIAVEADGRAWALYAVDDHREEDALAE